MPTRGAKNEDTVATMPMRVCFCSVTRVKEGRRSGGGREWPGRIVDSAFSEHFFVLFTRLEKLDTRARFLFGPDFAASLDERPPVPIRCARARSPTSHASMSDAKTPADFLKSIKGQKVLVKLNSGVDYRGIMSSLDGYMNIAMEQTEVRSRAP